MGGGGGMIGGGGGGGSDGGGGGGAGEVTVKRLTGETPPSVPLPFRATTLTTPTPSLAGRTRNEKIPFRPVRPRDQLTHRCEFHRWS